MALETATEAVMRMNQHGGMTIALSLFTLTLWVEGTAGIFSGLAKAWARNIASALELPRCFRIIRGYLARRRRRAMRRAVRFMQACDYAACRFYLNVVDRERWHKERIEKERIRHRNIVYMRVRRRITMESRRFEE